MTENYIFNVNTVQLFLIRPSKKNQVTFASGWNISNLFAKLVISILEEVNLIYFSTSLKDQSWTEDKMSVFSL